MTKTAKNGELEKKDRTRKFEIEFTLSMQAYGMNFYFFCSSEVIYPL